MTNEHNLSTDTHTLDSFNWLAPAPELQVVMVAFNYRLQALGFMALDELATSNGPDGGEGNFGLWDQLVALNWVKRNIEAFGGDPNNVCLFGPDSASAIALALLAGRQSRQASSPKDDINNNNNNNSGQLHAQLNSHDLFQSLWLTNPSLYFGLSAKDTNKHYAHLFASALKHCQKQNNTNTGGVKLKPSDLIGCLMNLTAEQVVRQYLSGEDPANRLDDQNSLPIHGIFADQFVTIDNELVASAAYAVQDRNLSSSSSINKSPSILLGSSTQAVDFWPCPRNLHNWQWPDFRRYVSASLNSFSLSLYEQASAVYKFPMDDNDANKSTTKSAKETYLSMVSDIRQICPINELAANLSADLANASHVYRYIVESRPSVQLRGLVGKEATKSEITNNNSSSSSINNNNDYADDAEPDTAGDQLADSLPEFAFHTWDLVAFFGFGSYDKPEFGRQVGQSDLRFQRQIREMVRKFVHSRQLDTKLTVFGKTGQLDAPQQDRQYKQLECELWRQHLGGNSYAWLS